MGSFKLSSKQYREDAVDRAGEGQNVLPFLDVTAKAVHSPQFIQDLEFQSGLRLEPHSSVLQSETL